MSTFNSLSRDHAGSIVLWEWIEEAFNSLSRDHIRVRAVAYPHLQTILTFNSLSRDHPTPSFPPLPGGVRMRLSTPSLGITIAIFLLVDVEHHFAPFNSLSRDHTVYLTRRQNNLRRPSFQLPLSGSLVRSTSALTL